MNIGKIQSALTGLSALSVYRGLLEDSVIKSFNHLLRTILSSEDFDSIINSYCEFYYGLLRKNSQFSFKDYLIQCIVFNDNPFTRLCEEAQYVDMDKGLLNAVTKDLRSLQAIGGLSAADIKDALICKSGPSHYIEVMNSLPEWNSNAGIAGYSIPEKKLIAAASDWSECVEQLCSFHRANGTGDFARYKAFVWERNGSAGTLKGIAAPDPVRLSELIGYQLERQEVIENTKHFLKGSPANNILLYGDRGTGKSSTVKGLLNEYWGRGLRIIEIPKMYLCDFPQIIRAIEGRKQKFILFIDDLAFEDSEESYTALKAVLEGGLEIKPRNAVIYATSNRRHLIKEKFADRSGIVSLNPEEEVRAADTMQEKLSLADRFGITVTFSQPDKKRYLEIVDGLAKSRGLDIDRETLHREALKWELWYNGRSPRTARQFIDWMEGKST